MKLIITGDTHLPGRGSRLPRRLLDACRDADLIIHTGDFRSPDVLETLSSYAKVRAVYGNIDGEDIQALVPDRQLFDAGGLRIGLVHGHGAKRTTEQRALEAFTDDDIDILIYGHSHIPVIKYFKGMLLLNPGSPTDKRKLPYYSFIELTIADEPHAELVLFSYKT
ncbi:MULTISPECIES: metallophosphoesterase family protein [Sporosarcina]|uniref:metallophosphoesterase family protein n=1 Tax=Sporosarcina TaxID=1569 RepID=UPI00058E0627|nr:MULTISPECIES: metallophosphoesterase family protein [Sporosarcina]WJY26905.1 metallophosphoesterase family protein [Sporosarcina sp. 0.2-SM1T-5]